MVSIIKITNYCRFTWNEGAVRIFEALDNSQNHINLDHQIHEQQWQVNNIKRGPGKGIILKPGLHKTAKSGADNEGGQPHGVAKLRRETGGLPLQLMGHPVASFRIRYTHWHLSVWQMPVFRFSFFGFKLINGEWVAGGRHRRHHDFRTAAKFFNGCRSLKLIVVCRVGVCWSPSIRSNLLERTASDRIRWVGYMRTVR